MNEFTKNCLCKIKEIVNDPEFYKDEEESLRRLFHVTDYMKEETCEDFFQIYLNRLLMKARSVLCDSVKKTEDLGTIDQLEEEYESNSSECFLKEKFTEKCSGADCPHVYGYGIHYENGHFVGEKEHVIDVVVKNVRNAPEAEIRFTEDFDIPYIGYEPVTEDGKLYRIPGQELEDFLYSAATRVSGENSIGTGLPSAMSRISPESVRTWYTFKDERDNVRTFIAPTDAMAKSIALSNSSLVRHVLNVSGCDDGETEPVMDETVLETSWNGDFLSWDATETEVEFLCRFRDRVKAEDIERQFRAHNSDGTEKDGILSGFNSKIEDLNRMISENRDRILHVMKCSAGLSDAASDQDLRAMEESFALDCGWVRFSFTDPALTELAKTDACYPEGKAFTDGSFMLRFPHETQSVTMQRYEADEVCRIARENGTDLRYYTLPD